MSHLNRCFPDGNKRTVIQQVTVHVVLLLITCILSCGESVRDENGSGKPQTPQTVEICGHQYSVDEDSISCTWNDSLNACDLLKFPQLKSAYIGKIEFPPSELACLGQLTSLESLSIIHTHTRDFSFLSRLKGLRTLELDVTPYFNHPEVFESLPHLTRLVIHGGLAAPSLKNSEALRFLEMESVTATDYSGLDGATGLEELSLFACDISDLSPLRGMTELTTLNLSGTDVKDLTLLQHLKKLKVLNLSLTDVVDLSPLQHVQNLTELDLSYSDDISLAGLSKLQKLRVLSLDESKVTDLSPLAESSVERLDVNGRIDYDLTELFRMKRLRSVGGLSLRQQNTREFRILQRTRPEIGFRQLVFN